MAIAISCGKPTPETRQQQPEAVAEESAKEFTIDTRSTTLGWQGSKNAGTHHGTIQLKSGTLSIEKNKVTAGNFVVNMKTIVDKDLTDPKENKKLVDDLSGENFFEVEKYPVSTFTITKSTKSEKADATGNNYSIQGNLTIKDVTRNITIQATIVIKGNELTARSTFSISRKEFNLQYAKGKIFRGMGDSIIHDTIEFNLVLKASAQK